jgi:hypothetical protein
VSEHLQAHPGKEFTPGEVARVLGRSSGAVANALDTLVAQDVAELTCEQPRRFRAASPDPETVARFDTDADTAGPEDRSRDGAANTDATGTGTGEAQNA